MVIKESVWKIIRKLKGNFSISDLTHHDELRGAKSNSNEKIDPKVIDDISKMPFEDILAMLDQLFTDSKFKLILKAGVTSYIRREDPFTIDIASIEKKESENGLLFLPYISRLLSIDEKQEPVHLAYILACLISSTSDQAEISKKRIAEDIMEYLRKTIEVIEKEFCDE